MGHDRTRHHEGKLECPVAHLVACFAVLQTPESDQPTKPVAEPVPKIEAVSKSEASPQEASEPRPVVEPVSVAEATPVLDAAPPESMGGQGATSKVRTCEQTSSAENENLNLFV